MTYQDFYSKFYDQIHNNKDYRLETNQLQKFIQEQFPNKKVNRILDFGCGTGHHLSALTKYAENLYGYDRSQAMLKKAMENYPTLFFSSDFGQIPKSLDLVYSLFDVCSYQISELKLKEYFEMMASKLSAGGLVIVDGWYLPGVRLSPPEIRERSLELEGLKILRTVAPKTIDNYQITDLSITLSDGSDGKILSAEEHTLRAFTVEEISQAARIANFTEISFRDGKNWQLPIKDTSWRFMMFATFNG